MANRVVTSNNETSIGLEVLYSSPSTFIENTIYLINGSDSLLPGVFSVSSTQKVNFTKGNLNYNPYNKIFAFPSNQYDYVGVNNQYISSTYNGYIDLFGYGTSGYNGKYPYLSSQTTSNYYNGNISGTNYDWGVYNEINGDHFRILTSSEWDYMLNSRSSSASINLRFCRAIVNSVNCFLIFPNNYVQPSSLPSINQYNTTDTLYTSNQFTSEQFKTMEELGVVCLPASGYRYGTTVANCGTHGNYWSGTNFSSTIGAYYMYFSVVNGNKGYYKAVACDVDRYYGFSVRLVKNV